MQFRSHTLDNEAQMNYPGASIQARIETAFHVAREKQTYINILYLLLSFPLGIFYFALLIGGLVGSLTSTVLLGIPVLILVMFVWWQLAIFERKLAIGWLHVEIP